MDRLPDPPVIDDRGADRMNEGDASLSRLLPLAEKAGARCNIAVFHNAVNLAFHAAESKVYDHVHSSMWRSLPAQIALLAADCERAGAASGNNLSLLDVGCGTGLSTELLLSTRLGQRIGSVSLVDTSPEMLALAEQRVIRLGSSPRTFVGEISSVPPAPSYDLILACSVLHHIPDIPAFLNQVVIRQPPGGVFLHLQDPNSDEQKSRGYRLRIEQFRRRNPASVFRAVLRRICPHSVAARIRHLTTHPPDYISETSSILMRQGIITKPMAARDIWSITDLHVENRCGVSLKGLRLHLQTGGYSLLQARSYAFFGPLQSELPAEFASKEAELIGAGAQDGGKLSAVWAKRATAIVRA
jgi:SAM-dependent methyltransferase